MSESMPQPKTRHDENFPVGSLLIASHLRPAVHAYYRFARTADDIADSPYISAAEKLERLTEMENTLVNPNSGAGHLDDHAAATSLRESMKFHGLPLSLASDLIVAFKRDARNHRYRTWGDLMEYCRFSACPVGWFLLALHGERDGHAASDALCSALQVLNHLQDVKDDFTQMERVYLPSDWLESDGVEIDELGGPAASPGLRRTIDRMTDYTAELIARAENLPGQLSSRRLATESAVCIRLASHLNPALRSQDPLATRVKLTPLNWLSAGLSGLKHLAFA